MLVDTLSLIWLFPVAFMLHDFEEVVLWEAWMAKNGPELKRRVPAVLAAQVDGFISKSTAQVSVGVCLIFMVTVLASFLAAQFREFGVFLLTGGMFFVHGFGHVGQVIVFKRYVPGVITSVLLVIPYGFIMFTRLTSEGIVGLPSLLGYLVLGAVVVAPFILLMHLAADYLYPRLVRRLVR
jgi:hypothetical protein